MKKLLIILFILFMNVPGYSQPYTIWEQIVGDERFNTLKDATRTSDNGIAAVGKYNQHHIQISCINNRDIWVVKINSWSDTLWTKTIGDIWGCWDAGLGIKETPDRGLIISGLINYPWGDSDIWLIKLDSLGNKLWERFIGEDMQEPLRGWGMEMGRAIDVTSDGGFIIAATKTDSTLDYRFHNAWIVRTDSQGDTLWTRLFLGEKTDKLISVIETSDGDLMFVGYTASFVSDSLDFDELWIVKLDSEGNLIWMNSYTNGLADLGTSIVESSDGNFLVGGMTYINENMQGWLFKIDQNGDILWSKTYGESGAERIFSLIQAEDGNIIFTGSNRSHPETGGFSDIWIVKTDSMGDSLWSMILGDSLENEARAIVAIDGDAVIVGHTYSVTDSFPWVDVDGFFARIGEAKSRLAVRDVSAYDNELIEVPIIFNYPLELSFNSVDISISGYSSNLTFLGINGTGSAVGDNGWTYDETISDTSFSVVLLGEASLTAMDTLFYADFIVNEFTEELITIRIDHAQIDSGTIPLEIYAGRVQLLRSIGIKEDKTSLPKNYSLSQNYPNPFNPVTTIEFSIPVTGKTTLLIYNLLGQEVARLVDDELSPGRYSYDWNASELSSGIYIYKLASGEFISTKKMVLLK